MTLTLLYSDFRKNEELPTKMKNECVLRVLNFPSFLEQLFRQSLIEYAVRNRKASQSIIRFTD